MTVPDQDFDTSQVRTGEGPRVMATMRNQFATARQFRTIVDYLEASRSSNARRCAAISSRCWPAVFLFWPRPSVPADSVLWRRRSLCGEFGAEPVDPWGPVPDGGGAAFVELSGFGCSVIGGRLLRGCGGEVVTRSGYVASAAKGWSDGVVLREREEWGRSEGW